MKRSLVVNKEVCSGCRLCELICCFSHDKVFQPSRARIQVTREEDKGIYVPIVCRQCKRPPCQEVCSVKAMCRDEVTGAMLIKYDLCTGCKECIPACPFGAITFDVTNGEVLNCDLCGGNPLCVNYCTTGAIMYATATEARAKAHDISLRRKEIIKEVTISGFISIVG